jgi:hypothetical protein
VTWADVDCWGSEWPPSLRAALRPGDPLTRELFFSSSHLALFLTGASVATAQQPSPNFTQDQSKRPKTFRRTSWRRRWRPRPGSARTYQQRLAAASPFDRKHIVNEGNKDLEKAITDKGCLLANITRSRRWRKTSPILRQCSFSAREPYRPSSTARTITSNRGRRRARRPMATPSRTRRSSSRFGLGEAGPCIGAEADTAVRAATSGPDTQPRWVEGEAFSRSIALAITVDTMPPAFSPRGTFARARRSHSICAYVRLRLRSTP